MARPLIRMSGSTVWILVSLWALLVTTGQCQSEPPTGKSERTHLEFLSRWFPDSANSATSVKLDQSARLATQVTSDLSQFESIAKVLGLIRDHVGFDQSEIESCTTATVATGTAGSLVFFTAKEPIPLDQHFASGVFPITPEKHKLSHKEVYYIAGEDYRFGLYSSNGKHFILGEWEVFKKVLTGAPKSKNSLTKLLSGQVAPIVICSNPRNNDRRKSRQDPFGTLMALDFQEDKLVFLLQEEHPTPAAASARLKKMDAGMPGAMETAYGLTTADGAQFRSYSDGRHVTYATQAPITKSSRLLAHLLGRPVSSNPYTRASKNAKLTIQLFNGASETTQVLDSYSSPEEIISALSVGVESKDGKRFQLPFLTSVEQDMVSSLLKVTDGKLALDEASNAETAATVLAEREIRRHAKLIATVTMSAASAKSPQLENTKNVKELVDLLCTTGINGGPGYQGEVFRGPEISPLARERVTAYLVPRHGYLVYSSKN